MQFRYLILHNAGYILGIYVKSFLERDYFYSEIIGRRNTFYMNVTLQKGIHYTYISEMLLEPRSFSLSSNNMYIIPLYYDANNYVEAF